MVSHNLEKEELVFLNFRQGTDSELTTWVTTSWVDQAKDSKALEQIEPHDQDILGLAGITRTPKNEKVVWIVVRK